MKFFRMLFFLWISSLSVHGHAQERILQSPLAHLEGSRLFKTGIDAYGRHFSGLLLFKAMPDSSIRIVLMSELGLNLLDMSYMHEAFTLVSGQEFMQRKSILRALENDFRTLLLDLSKIDEITQHTPGDEGLAEVRFRHRGQLYRYKGSAVPLDMEIKRRSCLFRRSTYLVREESGMQVYVQHRGVRMELKLKEIAR